MSLRRARDYRHDTSVSMSQDRPQRLGPGRVFSNDMTNTLLDHLDRNCGDRGLYTQQRNVALAEATILINKKHPATNVTKAQVKNKMADLSRHVGDRKDRKAGSTSLCLNGSSALQAAFLSRLKGGHKSASFKSDRGKSLATAVKADL